MRYGKLDANNKFAGIGKAFEKPSTRSRDARIRRGDDAITEALAGVSRPEEEYDEVEGFDEAFRKLHED